MGKEYLEALKSIKIRCHSKSMRYDPIDFDLETIEQALKRLEAIDNANPSEALKILETLADDGLLNKEIGTISYNQIWLKNQIKILQQALLKAEKNRKDLELIEKVRSGKTIIFVGKGLVMMNADKYHEYLKMEEEPISKKIKKCLKEQAWDIVVKKNIDMLLVKKYDNASDYNSAVWLSGREKLTEDEFDLLKECLE